MYRLVRPVSALGRSIPRHRLFTTTAPSRTKTSAPLRILFCGSEEFSCESLAALHSEHVANSRLVEALDVMVRPAKKTGRGLKQLRHGKIPQNCYAEGEHDAEVSVAPCKILAEDLGLKVHERDTFTGWTVGYTRMGEKTSLLISLASGRCQLDRSSLVWTIRSPADTKVRRVRGSERPSLLVTTVS